MRLIPVVAALLLCGCQSATTPFTGQADAPALSGPWLSLDEGIDHVSMDESGHYIYARGHYFGAELYEAGSLKKLRKFKFQAPYGIVNGGGFIDNNTLYWGYKEVGGGERNTVAEIWRIKPNEKLFSYEFDNSADHPLVANKRYIAYPNTLVDWRNGSAPMHALHAHPGEAGFYLITESGRVFSRNLLGKTLLLHDPKTNQRWYWATGLMPFEAALTHSERHVIAIDDTGACKVWRMPEIESLDRCGWGTAFTQKRTRLAVAPHAERFAVSVENRVRVYSLEPYALIHEFRLPDPVETMALTDEGRLAVADEKGHLSLWDSATGAALGQAEPGRVRELTFQAESRLLALASDGERYGLHLYDVPASPAEP